MNNFEQDKMEKEYFNVCIAWVGHTLNSAIPGHAKILEEFKIKKLVGQDGSLFDNTFAITCLGEPICLSEYATRLAKGSSTHVL